MYEYICNLVLHGVYWRYVISYYSVVPCPGLPHKGNAWEIDWLMCVTLRYMPGGQCRIERVHKMNLLEHLCLPLSGCELALKMRQGPAEKWGLILAMNQYLCTTADIKADIQSWQQLVVLPHSVYIAQWFYTTAGSRLALSLTSSLALVLSSKILH